MINLILGHKGSGKTKTLIDLVNAAAKETNGHVVCIEEKAVLTYNIDYSVRLCTSNDSKIKGYKAFYGYIAGIFASDNDITDLFVDATLKIGGRDYAALADFLADIYNLSEDLEKRVTFTISADKDELPDSIFNFCHVL